METELYASSLAGHSEAPSVLLAGFVESEADEISMALNKVGWNTISLQTISKIEQVFFEHRFDVTVVDAEHIEGAAESLIERLRNAKGLSSGATIVAVVNSLLQGLEAQLLQSGVDLVVPRPNDPKLYIIKFTRAATLRLRRIAKAIRIETNEF